MNKLMITTALALSFAAGAASAQSVLERVLGTIDGNTNMETVNGVFANIAENIGQTTGGNVYVDRDTLTVLTVDQIDANYAAFLNSQITAAKATVNAYDSNGSEPGGDGYRIGTGTTLYATQALAEAAAETAARNLPGNSQSSWLTAQNIGQSYYDEMAIMTAIDGSITNVLTGVTGPTSSVDGAVLAVEQVTVELGDMATTVLGAVNTGEITLGVNQDVSEAIAGSSSAVSSAIEQLGGSVDASALVLNVASNATDVIGSVNTTMTGLNATMGSVATTVLGAVNTGTITSGVNSAVEGIQSGIVGTP